VASWPQSRQCISGRADGAIQHTGTGTPIRYTRSMLGGVK